MLIWTVCSVPMGHLHKTNYQSEAAKSNRKARARFFSLFFHLSFTVQYAMSFVSKNLFYLGAHMQPARLTLRQEMKSQAAFLLGCCCMYGSVRSSPLCVCTFILIPRARLKLIGRNFSRAVALIRRLLNILFSAAGELGCWCREQKLERENDALTKSPLRY